MDYKKMKPIGLVRQMLTDGVITKEQAAKYFPELKESEDEKIKKWLIGTLRALHKAGLDINGADEMMLPSIAWLEKQGEQKPVEWSEEDEKMLSDIIVFVSGYAMKEVNKEWVNFLKYRLPQKISNVERNEKNWKPSDEEMKALAEALSLANNCGEESAFDLRTLYKQLKKLREE